MIQTNWDFYYVVFLSAILSLGIPMVLMLVSFLFVPKNGRGGQPVPSFEKSKSNRMPSGHRMNVQFFLAANAALMLATLGLALVPCVTIINSENLQGLVKALMAIVTVAGFAILGLLYSVRKGDMGWQCSTQVGQVEAQKGKK